MLHDPARFGVRALYEGSAVPVAQIAQLAGVTERTIYKYVSKHGWTRRYRVIPRGQAAAVANRGRRQQHAPDFAPSFAPVRGAGGRFIRRADKEGPFAHGLKAADPAARARAEAACGMAARLAHAAQAQAETMARHEARLRAIDRTNRALADLVGFLKDRSNENTKQDAKAGGDQSASRPQHLFKNRLKSRPENPRESVVSWAPGAGGLRRCTTESKVC